MLMRFARTWKGNRTSPGGGGRPLATTIFQPATVGASIHRIFCSQKFYGSMPAYVLRSGSSGVRGRTAHNVAALLNRTALSTVGIGPSSRKATKRFCRVCRDNRDRSECRDGLFHTKDDAFLLVCFSQVSLNSENHFAGFLKV